MLSRPMGLNSDNALFRPIILFKLLGAPNFVRLGKEKELPSWYPVHIGLPEDHTVESFFLTRSAQVLGFLLVLFFSPPSHWLRFGFLFPPTSSGAISNFRDWRMTEKNQFWDRYWREQHKLFFFSLHYNQSQSNKKTTGGWTQFIPGALPPKLKLVGTSGTVNLYPPCFSIILDSATTRQNGTS